MKKILFLAVLLSACRASRETVVTFTHATIGSSTQLYINTKSFKLYEEFFPMPFSANGIFIGYVTNVGYGIYAPHLLHDDYLAKANLNKKIFVIESAYPDNAPDGKFSQFTLRKRVEYAISRGATAVIFINSDSTIADPKAVYTAYSGKVAVPVVFAGREAARILKYSNVTNCIVGVELIWHEKKGYRD